MARARVGLRRNDQHRCPSASSSIGATIPTRESSSAATISRSAPGSSTTSGLSTSSAEYSPACSRPTLIPPAIPEVGAGLDASDAGKGAHEVDSGVAGAIAHHDRAQRDPRGRRGQGIPAVRPRRVRCCRSPMWDAGAVARPGQPTRRGGPLATAEPFCPRRYPPRGPRGWPGPRRVGPDRPPHPIACS